MSKARLAGPVIAVMIIIVFAIWMTSGAREEASAQTEPPVSESRPTKSLIPTVQAVDSLAREVQQSLTINGITRAQRHVTVSSEGAGKVVAIRKVEGDSIREGDIIAQLDTKDIPIQIAQAQAFETQTQLEYQGALKLEKQGLINEAQTAALFASSQQAKAQLASLQLQLNNTTIVAPFDGQVEASDLEIGTFIGQGDPVAEIYDYSKLVFEGSVSEKDIAKLKLGQAANVELISGDTVPATVSYIGTVADPITRTFTVELEIKQVGRYISGVTSTAKVSLNSAQGHYISPALLFINADGLLGLKTLSSANKVEFFEVEIIQSGTDGVWVQGLPDQVRIIIVGQGFVDISDITSPTVNEFDPTKAVGL